MFGVHKSPQSAKRMPDDPQPNEQRKFPTRVAFGEEAQLKLHPASIF